jgi:tagatose 1,6-diphosphate aldolase
MKTEFIFLDPRELMDDDLHLVLVRKHPGDPARKYVPEYTFEMRHTGSSEKIGEIRLRIGDLPEYIGHISYGVLKPHRGHHYAARACKLIAQLARRHGVSELSITCLPDNAASKRTCELAGASFVGMVDVPDEGVDDYHKNIDCKCKYILKTEEMDNKLTGGDV